MSKHGKQKLDQDQQSHAIQYFHHLIEELNLENIQEQECPNFHFPTEVFLAVPLFSVGCEKINDEHEFFYFAK